MGLKQKHKDKHGVEHPEGYYKIIKIEAVYANLSDEHIGYADIHVDFYHDEYSKQIGAEPITRVIFRDEDFSKKDVRKYDNVRKMGYVFLKELDDFAEAEDV